VVMVWRGSTTDLTAEGITCSTPLFRRFVPWQALAPGGPSHPQPGATWLELAVMRPELVKQRGWAAGSGPKERPRMSLSVAMEPRFLADAIRWYTEHPADRATIGTATEHDRLVAALTAAQPATAQATVHIGR
jgi:hypothetical protein